MLLTYKGRRDFKGESRSQLEKKCYLCGLNNEIKIVLETLLKDLWQKRTNLSL